MSPKQVKITPGSCAIAMPSSTRPIGITQTGQPGPCTSSTFVRQQVVDPVLVDRVGVPAAHLHHLVVPAGLDGREDLAGQHLAELGVAELVDEPHASTCSAVPACTSRRSPSRDRLDERDLDARRARPPRPRTAPARWRASIRTTRIGTASSPQVMQTLVVADRRHSIRLSRSSGELLLVVGAHALEQPQRGLRLLLVDLGEREADVDQDPVSRLRAVAVGVEQADVDRCAGPLRRRPSRAGWPRRRSRRSWPGMARHIGGLRICALGSPAANGPVIADYWRASPAQARSRWPAPQPAGATRARSS